jgi:hypothetical protein
MRFLAIFLIIFGTAIFTNQVIAQVDEVSYINDIGKKNIATVNDGLKLFKLVIEKKQPAAKDDPANNVPLKKGFIALMVANNLNLTDSVIFTLFKKERYAFRACAAHNLLNADGSENDLMSGEELIEFLRLASDYKDKGAAK